MDSLQAIHQEFYRAKMDWLRAKSDALLGIQSHREGNTWLRDATRANPIPDALPAQFEAHEALLRCISRVRAVDYAISSQDLDTKAVMDAFVALEQDIYEDGANIAKLETDFNTFLIKALHDADLAQGCVTVEDAKQLLFHYRILSSVLDPAMTLVTVTYDETLQMLQREVQTPVTQKTSAQKQVIKNILKEVNPLATGEALNAHSYHKIAMQQADQIFADLIAQDDRRLPAQARKTHAVGGVRNAFVVEVETTFGISSEDIPGDLTNPLQDSDALKFVRTGVPVFVGGGETKENVQTYTQQNIEQLKNAAGKSSAHLLVLNTDISREKQNIMLEHMRKATDEHSPDEFSNVPVNDVGALFFSSTLSQDVQNEAQFKNKDITVMAGDKVARANLAAEVLLNVADKQGVASVVLCASGQDRTGTVSEIAIEKHTLKHWIEHYKKQHGGSEPGKNEVEAARLSIEHTRARGTNAAEVASFAMPGSPGMKYDSLPVNFKGAGQHHFSVEAQRMLYRGSADTNKKNKVDKKKVREILLEPTDKAKNQFSAALIALGAKLQALKPEDESNTTLKPILQAGQSLHGLFEWEQKAKRPNAKHLYYMTVVLNDACGVLDKVQEGKMQGLDEHIFRLNVAQEKLKSDIEAVDIIGKFCVAASVTALVVALIVIPPPISIPLSIGAAAMLFVMGGVLEKSSHYVKEFFSPKPSNAVSMQTEGFKNALEALKAHEEKPSRQAEPPPETTPNL